MSRGTHLTARLDVDAAVAELFTPRLRPLPGPGHVGLEVELIPVIATGDGPPRRVTLARVQAVATRAGAPVQRLGNITYEPGGQIELSPRCAASARQAVDVAIDLVQRLRAAAAAEGIHLIASGCDPWHHPDEVGLQLDKPRYRAMQAHFDRIGDAGRRMMRCTAALQICLDLGGGAAASERWRLINAAGPALMAALANSPVRDGRPAPAVTTRSLAWQSADRSRTGFDGRQVDGGQAGYAQMALDAAVVSMAGGEPGSDLVPGTTLRHWVGAGGRQPDQTDLDDHLSTLFPPVRPRGYMEVRYLDALPLELIPTAVALLVTLSEDPVARREGLEAAAADPRPWDERWRSAAGAGLADPLHRALAGTLVRLAAAGAARLPSTYLPEHSPRHLTALAERVESGRCPADDRREAFALDPHEVAAWA